MKITKLESTILQAIAQNEMNECNYGVPSSHLQTLTYVYALDTCTLREGQVFPDHSQLSGIISSLSKKGLIYTDGNCIGHTEAGFEIWKKEFAS